MPTKKDREAHRISRPPDEVFDYLCDIDRLQDWATTVVQTRDVPAGAISAGATFTQSIRVAGRSVETQGRVTEFDRPRRRPKQQRQEAAGW